MTDRFPIYYVADRDGKLTACLRCNITFPRGTETEHEAANSEQHPKRTPVPRGPYRKLARRTLFGLLALAALAALLPAVAWADSIPLATVVIFQAPSGLVDLAGGPLVGVSNPDVDLALRVSLKFPSPAVDTPITYDIKLSVGTFSEERLRTATVFGSAPGTFNFIGETFNPGACCDTPTPASLTILHDGVSRTFTFSVLDPVPEPSTWLLAGTGVGLLGLVSLWRRYFRSDHQGRVGASSGVIQGQ